MVTQSLVGKVELLVRPMQDADLPSIVNLHLHALGYSLNTNLGGDHLTYLYNVIHADKDSIVLAAIRDGVCVGVCSATTDPEQLTRTMFSGLSVFGWSKILFKILRQPSMLRLWYETRSLSHPVFYAGKAIIPCLTTIAVDEEFRGQGIGSALILAVDKFFGGKQRLAYRLDTVLSNSAARLFYLKNGFIEAEQRGKHIVFVKMI